jgi:hypothetical protein
MERLILFGSISGCNIENYRCCKHTSSYEELVIGCFSATMHQGTET